MFYQEFNVNVSRTPISYIAGCAVMVVGVFILFCKAVEGQPQASDPPSDEFAPGTFS